MVDVTPFLEAEEKFNRAVAMEAWGLACEYGMNMITTCPITAHIPLLVAKHREVKRQYELSQMPKWKRIFAQLQGEK